MCGKRFKSGCAAVRLGAAKGAGPRLCPVRWRGSCSTSWANRSTCRAAKGRRRYRYYVSKGLIRGESVSAEEGWRLSAPAIEQAVSVAAQKVLGDQSAISLVLEESAIDASRLPM